MASGRQCLQRAKSLLSSTTRKFSSPGAPTPIRRNPLLTFREPVELSCAQSLMPLHSATASSLLRSMLSSKVGQWGSLSEGAFLYWVFSYLCFAFHKFL
ncbi:hypothetical protein Tco_1057462 [Tanacetum coccineum]|uniref:Protein NUCLEAR FUSION DEFECTIVE 6, chloroplastic/mitochondrial-like n=1 Tax=Tanacetum coccineum TaxID=301880 RepID=A0ABQ5H5G5_9ASTR